MFSSNSRPKWWQLYLTFPLLLALFLFEHKLNLSPGEHEAIQIGIVLLIYALISWWLKANSSALSGMDQQKQYRVRIIQIPPLQYFEDDATHSMLQLPASEVKGMLGNTFEMDEVSQETHKEQK